MRSFSVPLFWVLVVTQGWIHRSTCGQSVSAFLDQHCAECHDADVQKGGLDLTALSLEHLEPEAMAKWVRVFDRVMAGEMPPEKKERPPELAQDAFLAGLAECLVTADEARKGTVLRRLNRVEFENTLNDLFGTRVKVAAMLPEDGRAHEFDNVGEALGMSMVHLQRYMQAIDVVLDAAIAKTQSPPEVKRIEASYATDQDSQKFIGQQWLKRPDGAVVFFQPTGYPSGTLKSANVREAGWYQVRVTGYAWQSETPVTFELNTDTFERGGEKPNLGYFSFKPGEPQTVEVKAWLPARYMIQIRPWGISDAKFDIKNKGVKNYPGQGLAIQSVEIEGPLADDFPGPGHRLLFDGLNRHLDPKANPKNPQFVIESADPSSDVTPVLQRVATAAFRRSVEVAELEDFRALFADEMSRGSSFEAALRSAVKAIFCSPEFLYLRERSGYLDSHAIASRLSYFLTRTGPDGGLRKDADEGKLHTNPAVLMGHAARLMKTEHFERFVVDFTDAWLNLRDIDFTQPDQILFPEFDQFLRNSMLSETRAYFRELIEKNLPVTHLVKSDFAMLNNRLAQHYGIDGVEGTDVRRVSLPPDSVRGSFIGQGSVLKVSANGTNTSPVMRGIWLVERIFGQTPPPPPPGVPGVEPDIRGATTLRELLVKHRDQANCRACHEGIDPPGFALESFNPIGGWRERYRSLGEGEKVDAVVSGKKVRYKLGPSVDASGQMKGGAAFGGFKEFQDLVAADDRTLTKTLATKLLTFATGREMGFSDREEIDRITAESAKNGHRIGDLVRLVITSEIFRKK